MDNVVEETKVAEELGTFDEVTVWNHDVPWDAAEDSYAKGIGEWISFANAVRG
jgi:ribonuclease H2 subunit C